MGHSKTAYLYIEIKNDYSQTHINMIKTTIFTRALITLLAHPQTQKTYLPQMPPSLTKPLKTMSKMLSSQVFPNKPKLTSPTILP
jgi:hypothetical protein